jgi:hypothetical protein
LTTQGEPLGGPQDPEGRSPKVNSFATAVGSSYCLP